MILARSLCKFDIIFAKTFKVFKAMVHSALDPNNLVLIALSFGVVAATITNN
jgi:hypothetical protein